MTDRFLRSLETCSRECFWGIVSAAVAARILLVWFSPWAFGYVWDLYHEVIQLTYARGALPNAPDCWECWQPPLLFVAARPLYAVGRWLYPTSPWPDDAALRVAGVIPLAAGAACLVYLYRLLVLLRQRGSWLNLGLALAAALPCLFVSTYSLEPDIVLTAIMIAFLYYLTRWHRFPESARALDIVRLGVLAGLAAETKYNGLIAAVVGTVVLACGGMRRVGWKHRPGTVAVFVAVALAVGSWKYVDNLRRYGVLLYANGPAITGFTLADRVMNTKYEFTTFRLGSLFVLTRPDAAPGMLTTLSVYRSVWTTLHGLGWGDMGFFSNPTRHGTRYPFYTDRHVPPPLASAVLALGIIPDLLSLGGLVLIARRRRYLPLTVMCVMGWLMYLQYMLSQEDWALKAKYLLFLLPVYVFCAVIGLRRLRAILPGPVTAALVIALMALIVVSHAYLLSFAVG